MLNQFLVFLSRKTSRYLRSLLFYLSLSVTAAMMIRTVLDMKCKVVVAGFACLEEVVLASSVR